MPGAHSGRPGKELMNATNISGWDENHCYEFRAYPDIILVITNADRDAFTKAVEEFGSSDGMKNIEEILWQRGFTALACSANATSRESEPGMHQLPTLVL